MLRWLSGSTGRCSSAASPRVLRGSSAEVASRRGPATLTYRERSMNRKIVLGLTIAAVAFAGVAVAQQSAIKRTPLQKLDFPPGYNTVTAIAEVPAGGAAGRHTHPGAET